MEELKSIVTCFDATPDPRRGAGQPHEQTFVLIITLMSTISGYIGYRAIGNFIKRNRSELPEHSQPSKGRLPGFDTVRCMMQGIDFSEVNKQFNQWAAQYRPAAGSRRVSMDGKTICGTVTLARDTRQQVYQPGQPLLCAAAGSVKHPAGKAQQRQ